MQKVYLNENVYNALTERLDYIFQEFDNILVSFSGGKDSGLLYQMVLKYMRDRGIHRPIGLFHQDFEAQYQYTTDFVTRIFDDCPAHVEPFWVCLPMATRTNVSNYELYWYPWDDDKPEIWVRPMPERPEVISLNNNPLDYYRYKMPQEDLARKFAQWYGKHCGGGKTICLLGLRATESLNRYSGIINKKYAYNGHAWITKQYKDTWSASPLYDWETEDVWTATGKFGFDYNRLYDMMYKAGLSIHDMRVASPFNEYASHSLNLYRIIEPDTWSKLVGRVQGANFGAIYGNTKAMGYKEVTLPEGHTWKSYTMFLLSTLPEYVREQYLEKFKTSIEFWHKTGGGLPEESIKEIEECGYQIRTNGISNYTKNQKKRVVFEQQIPDDTDDVKSTIDIPSWKRMCFCILKNDHLCRFMGFGLSREQQKRISALKQKYTSIMKGVVK